MLFANVILMGESDKGVNQEVEMWKMSIESKSFRISTSRVENMH